MRFALSLAAVAAFFLYVGWGGGPAGAFCFWAGASFLWTALAYLLGSPRMLGKRPDGGLAWWAKAGLAPYLAFAWLGLRLHAARGSERACDEVSPGLWLGRRAAAFELPAEVGMVVDLTSEFEEPSDVADGREYLSLPTLDGEAPEEAAFQAAVERAAMFHGGVYVHCAVGHGRSAVFAAALLLRKGLAPDPDAAVRLVREARPGVGLGRGQRELLRRYDAFLKSNA